ncbi:hypothetical protein PRIC2_005028 [Phytophthora ramorum]
MALQRLLLLLVMALCVPPSASQSLRTAPHLQPPRSLHPENLALCSNFVLICDFVTANCDSTAQTPDQNAKCVDSFNLFYQHNSTLTRCVQELPADSSEKAKALEFVELYSAWQQQNVCKLFHTTEAKAATECSGANAHRPWKQAAWPLYCHEVFTMYNGTRHELDQLCGRTANTEAFWEGFVDYIGSATCKRYYDLVREAGKLECGEKDKAAECREMFQWYVANQEVVETDCYELRASKPFYRGFYAWKKQQS